MDFIGTERLRVRLLDDDEMAALIAREPSDELKAAYRQMLDGCLAHPDARMWYGVWAIELPDGTFIGDLCFKGLMPDGAAEIGYGLLDDFQGFGYAAEAVTALTDLALRQNGVSRIEAETLPQNLASQRVLAKAGFVPAGRDGDEGPRFVKTAK